jgi:hypothetical protein
MTAAQAHCNTDLRARVALAVRTSPRTVADLLDGYEGQPMLAMRIRVALAEAGVDLATIPARTPAEVLAWKRRRHPRCKGCAQNEAALVEISKLAMPEGFALEQCDCGREYPRMQSEATGRCPKCWRKHAESIERGLAESRAEVESMQNGAADAPVPIRRAK